MTERLQKARETFGEPKVEPEELLGMFYQFSDACDEQLKALDQEAAKKEREEQRARLAEAASVAKARVKDSSSVPESVSAAGARSSVPSAGV